MPVWIRESVSGNYSDENYVLVCERRIRLDGRGEECCNCARLIKLNNGFQTFCVQRFDRENGSRTALCQVNPVAVHPGI